MRNRISLTTRPSGEVRPLHASSPASFAPTVIAAIVAAALGGPALAQQAPADTPQAGPTPRLDPVVISGTGGVERRAFDTPAAVTVVDAEELRSGGLMVNLSETLTRVPGLTANMRSNYAQDLQISSRGYGARAQFGIRGIRLYTDGIPAAAPDGSGSVSHFDIAGAQRIEVLRGPFSALYGNSSGGVISLVSAPPTERAIMVDGDIGRFDTHQVRLGIEAPFDGGFSIRAQTSRFMTDNFRDHAEARRDLTNIRLGWAGERDTVTVLVNSVRQPADDPQGLDREQFDEDPYQTAVPPIEFDTRKISEQTQIGAQWKHRFGGVLSESALMGYAGKRSVKQWQSIPPPPQLAETHPGGVIDLNRDYYGVDARLVWRWERAQLVTGVSLEEQKDDRRGYRNFIGDPVTGERGVTGELRRDETNRARTTDVYAQGEIDLGSDVSATVGVRSGQLRVKSDDDFVTGGNFDDSGSKTFHYTNPVAALQWRPSANLNTYVSVGRGFESPTLNEMAYRSINEAGFNTDLDAQRSVQVEVGTKWRDPEAGLGIDVAVFRTTTRDEIGVLPPAVGGRTVFGNVGRTERKGLEIGARWQATETIRTLLALTYLDAKYTDGDNDGNRIAGTMKNSAFFEAAWVPAAGTEIAAELRHHGTIPVNDTNTDQSDSAYLLGLRASQFYDLPAGRLELLARVDNLTDREYAASVIVNDGNGRFFEAGAPRAWLVSARWRVGF